MAQVTEVSG